MVSGQKYQVRGIILYILVDANWCNGGDIPNESEFMLSTGTHTFRACLISQTLHNLTHLAHQTTHFYNKIVPFEQLVFRGVSSYCYLV